MYLSELIPVIADLQSLVGEPLVEIRQSRRDRVDLRLGARWLTLVPRGPYARLSESTSKERSPRKPFSFQGACRAHLAGRLRALNTVGDDREVQLLFDQGELRLRLTGRGGGLWLLSDERVVAAYDGPAKELPALPSANRPERQPRFTSAPGRWPTTADQYFRAEEAAARTEQEVLRLTRLMRSERQRLTRLLRHLDSDAKSAADWPQRQRAADALAAVLWKLPPGASTALVQDLEDPSLQHRVTLDPKKRPGENLGRLYERVKRLKARAETSAERRVTAEDRLAEVLHAMDELQTGRLDDARRLAPASPPKATAAVADPGIERWVGPRGLECWIGRSAKANHRLTFQKARGRDWWMHVRGLPGAHLILPMRGRSSPHLEWLLAGAQLVARRSRLAPGTACDVQYAPVKHIQAIPGDAHGRVRVAAEKVLHITVQADPPQGWTLVPT